MSKGTFSDLLIRLETFKRIFAFRPKIDFLARSNPKVFGVKFFHSFMSLRISACRKTPLGIVLKCK